MSESQKISDFDNMGREKFWEDLGRPENDGLALKIFKEECCENCSCKSDNQCYNTSMTEIIRCCAGCTCENSHSSKPPVDTKIEKAE